MKAFVAILIVCCLFASLAISSTANACPPVGVQSFGVQQYGFQQPVFVSPFFAQQAFVQQPFIFAGHNRQRVFINQNRGSRIIINNRGLFRRQQIIIR